ncbi:MAG TPA: PLP-dependent aminotransferase family protein [Silvibacterium sp.]|nr:PLP-dependent aminotransferase family protein [Silvibacterium sp.]
MRKPKGVFLPPLRAARPKRGDVYGALRDAVLQGVLSHGDRLPSTRKAAEDYGVSRGLMEEVFGQLADEGFFERSVGRGTFVAARVAPLEHSSRRERRRSANASRRGQVVAANAACREPENPRAFNAGTADIREFPWRLWWRLQNRAARELGHAAFGFADPRGLSNLREAIARYLAQFRGIRCTAKQVIIFNSAQQALMALAVLLLNRGDEVWIEDPCYLGARAAFRLADAIPVPVPVDKEGIHVMAGLSRAARARLAYVTPSHQYPTGVAVSLERRFELLEWVKRSNSWVIEDDYDGEFRYAGQPLSPLYALDTQARVFYLGTLSKSMFISLRLAYLLIPEEFVEPITNIRTQMDGFTPPLPQMTMALFMDEGHFSSHLRKMSAVYGAKRKTLVDGLAPMAELGWTWSSNPAGVHLLVMHSKGDYVRAVRKASKLDLALLSRYRVARARSDGLFLRFGALDVESLQAGAAELVKLCGNLDRKCSGEVVR